MEANGRSDDGLLTIKSRGCFGTRIDLHYMGARQHKGKIRWVVVAKWNEKQRTESSRNQRQKWSSTANDPWPGLLSRQFFSIGFHELLTSPSLDVGCCYCCCFSAFNLGFSLIFFEIDFRRGEMDPHHALTNSMSFFLSSSISFYL